MADARSPSRLDELASWLPKFESPAFTFGEWTPAKREGDAFTLGYFVFSEQAGDFIQALYDAGWINSNFAWMQWANGPEATRLQSDRSAVRTANERQIEQLLTMVVRRDRFAEGSLADDYESGLIVAILRRAAVLADRTRTRGGDK